MDGTKGSWQQARRHLLINNKYTHTQTHTHTYNKNSNIKKERYKSAARTEEGGVDKGLSGWTQKREVGEGNLVDCQKDWSWWYRFTK